jgi:hypothetical protein
MKMCQVNRIWASFSGALLAVLGSCFLSPDPAGAAVFVLKNVVLNVNSSPGNGAGTYSVTGEFKVDTYYASYPPGTYNQPSAWNISIASTSGASDFNGSYVFNTPGTPDDSFSRAPGGSGTSILLCKTVNAYCDNVLDLYFLTRFYDVYKDGVVGSPAVAGPSGTTLLDVVTLKTTTSPNLESSDGEIGIASGRADFVPLSPVPLVILPILSGFKSIKRRSGAFLM